MITVCFTVNNRPRYLRETLASWSAARGVDDVAFVFRCEPGCDEARDLCSQFAGEHGGFVTVNPHRYGVLGNPWAALETGFSADDDSNFCVLAEEDLIVSPDVLEFFTWCQQYHADPQVLGITSYQHDEQPGGLTGVGVADWSRDDQWHFWVWGTWRDRWANLISHDWDFTYRADCGCPPNMRGWDWAIRNHLIRDRGMKMIAPSLCRSQHIGKFGGSHATPDQFEGLLSRCFAGLDVPPQDYQQVTWPMSCA